MEKKISSGGGNRVRGGTGGGFVVVAAVHMHTYADAHAHAHAHAKTMKIADKDTVKDKESNGRKEERLTEMGNRVIFRE